jgi:hypothetical protein
VVGRDLDGGGAHATGELPLLLGLVAVWPFLEVHFTRDLREHHLLDRPRDGREHQPHPAGAVVRRPVVCWLATYYTCGNMRDTGAHPGLPSAGLLLRRTTSGEYQTIPAGDTGDGGWEPVVRRSASSAPRHTPPTHGMPEK